MNKFRFKVWRNDYTVIMKIFEQPEETRGMDKLFEYNNMVIRSVCRPQLTNVCIYLRGAHRNMDNIPATIRFGSLDKAEAYRKAVTEALNAYAKHLEEQTTPKCANKQVNVLTLK